MKDRVNIEFNYFKDTGKLYCGGEASIHPGEYPDCIYPRDYARQFMEQRRLPGIQGGYWDGPLMVCITYPELVLPTPEVTTEPAGLYQSIPPLLKLQDVAPGEGTSIIIPALASIVNNLATYWEVQPYEVAYFRRDNLWYFVNGKALSLNVPSAPMPADYTLGIGLESTRTP